MKILWLDNDAAFVAPFADVLRDDGIEVDVTTTLRDAEHRLASTRYALVIIDTMIPTKSAAEEVEYPPEATACGNQSGLIFYSRVRGSLEAMGTRVMVFTVRMDAEIKTAWLKAGVPNDAFATKVSLRDATRFKAAVARLAKR